MAPSGPFNVACTIIIQAIYLATTVYLARAKAVIENPVKSDWFFYYIVMEFIKAFYVGVLGATDYWMRFEWQHRVVLTCMV